MKIKIIIFFLLVITMLNPCAFTSTVLAADSGSFGITVGSENVKQGDRFTVTVSGNDIRDLTAYEICLSFDNGKLDFIDAVSAIDGYPVLVPSGSGNEVRFALAKTKGQSAENGDLMLCTLTFSSKATGTADLILKSVKLMDESLVSNDYYPGEKVTISIAANSSVPDSEVQVSDNQASGIIEEKEGTTANISIAVSAKTDKATGTATARIEENTAEALVNAAKNANTARQKAVIEIKVEAEEPAANVQVEIPGSSLRQMADETSADICIKTGVATVTFDSKAVDTISGLAPKGDICVSISNVDKAVLTEEVRKRIGDRPVCDFSVKAGDTKISDFEGGKVEIKIPYTLKPDEMEDSVVAYYIGNDGNLQAARGQYDFETGTVILTVKHFSVYAVGYNHVNFKDVAPNAWYGKAVGFMGARSIILGVGDGSFMPERNVTRADFLIMLMKSYGINLDTDNDDNFVDAANKYYTPYLATAKRLGLVMGIDGNRYAPEENISRQDMFVILYRALGMLGELPEGTSGRKLESFSDASSIPGYAREAIKLFVETGIVQGDGVNLTPREISSRAQAVQVLYNLISK